MKYELAGVIQLTNINPKGNVGTHIGAGPSTLTVGPTEHAAIISQGGAVTDAVKSGYASKANVT